MGRDAGDAARGGDARMRKKARVRLSPLAVAVPIGVCIIIAVFTYTIAVRAGFPAGLSVAVAGVIGLLWLSFFIGRLIEQARTMTAERER